MVDRRSISQRKRAEIFLRQEGRCADCGEKLRLGAFDIDHRQALIHGGNNADDNLQAICINCHKAKTRKDVHARSHCDRIAVGGKKRKGKPMPGSRDSGWKKPMNGPAERRT